jgi:hypothetical protein
MAIHHPNLHLRENLSAIEPIEAIIEIIYVEIFPDP